MTTAPLAYKYVATAVMLLEVNYCASRLPLPLDHPVRREDLRRIFISHPRVMGLSGTFETDKCIFSFAKSARLSYIINLKGLRYDMEGGSSARNAYLMGLTRVRSLIDRNGAYRLAKNWLTKLEVDVRRLEKEHQSKVERRKLLETNPIPIFEVTWGEGEIWISGGRPVSMPCVSVVIARDTCQLIHVKQDDDSYSKRPEVLINNMCKLLAIPDAEFLKYTEKQRNNLVARFAAVQYPPLTNFTAGKSYRVNVPQNVSKKN